MKFLVAFTCLLAVATAKPGVLGHAHLAGHAVAPGFSYSSVTAHAAPIVAHAAPIVAHTAPASVAHHVAVAHAAPASVAHHVAIGHAPAVAHAAYAAAPAVVHHAAPAAAIAAHSAFTHHAAAVAPAIAHHAAIAAPVAVAHAAPFAVAAPVIEKTQYHAQDIIGQASYGHTEAFQQHHAVQDAAGNKIGSYSWVAPNGQVIAGKYVADALGYRVHSNAVPVGPAPVAETPEVVAARSAHIAAHIAAKTHHHLVRRGIVTAPAVAYTTAPLHYASHYTSALVSPVVHTHAHLHYGLY